MAFPGRARSATKHPLLRTCTLNASEWPFTATRQTNTGSEVGPNGAVPRSAAVAERHIAEAGVGRPALASSASSSRRPVALVGACEDVAVLEPEVGRVLLIPGPVCALTVLNEPQAEATHPVTSTAAPTARRADRELMALVSLPLAR